VSREDRGGDQTSQSRKRPTSERTEGRSEQPGAFDEHLSNKPLLRRAHVVKLLKKREGARRPKLESGMWNTFVEHRYA
jgi:hypothetical protein